jgi:glycosyltransferase involved in cell wall biosynthesis
MISNNGQTRVILDLRCLQDPNYSSRGIGRHALAMLRGAPHSIHIVGLIDPTLPTLLPEARDAVHSVQLNAYAASRSGAPQQPPTYFVMMSPMTHDPIFSARLLSDPTLLRAAVVYDFIPRRFPHRYLPTPVEQLSYAAALRWLARCDLFLPISQHTADDLKNSLSVGEKIVAVTGCPLEPSFERLEGISGVPHRHLLLVGGGDPRKNPEVVIRAHARSSTMQSGKGIPLVVAGNYGEVEAAAFRAVAEAAGGRVDLVEVPGHVSDSKLFELYVSALLVVTASVDEGFSIPLIEAMAAGIPCLASDIPAHAELVSDPECRFPPHDDAALSSKVERLVVDADWTNSMLARQAQMWPRFRAQTVADRFWNAVLRGVEARAPRLLRGHRPRVALLSPLPPDRSGVADYTAATCAELGKLVDLHAFTETSNATPVQGLATVRPIGALPHLMGSFDRVISVLGNSHFHRRIFELLCRYGAACIAHDARMLGFYHGMLGTPRTLALASQELGRIVEKAELNAWLADESTLKTLFLSEVIAASSPMIVHSPVTAQMVREQYGATVIHLPFSIYRPWPAGTLSPAARAAARRRLGLPEGDIVIATFGFVHDTKAPDECIWALELLRGWGIQASLHFVGGSEHLARGAIALRALIAQLRLADHVVFGDQFVSEQTYNDYLLGADVAIQLRTYGLGGLSGAVLDCAAAGLPMVTNESLGTAVGVPTAYSRMVPDALSPLQIAEAVVSLLDAGLAVRRPDRERQAFCEERSLASYTTGLCHALDLDVWPLEVAAE